MQYLVSTIFELWFAPLIFYYKKMNSNINVKFRQWIWGINITNGSFSCFSSNGDEYIVVGI
jgi:hypothetical protein